MKPPLPPSIQHKITNYKTTPDEKAYFYLLNLSRGTNPVVHQWALERLVEHLTRWVDLMVECIRYDAPKGVKKQFRSWFRYAMQHSSTEYIEDIKQSAMLCLVRTLRKVKMGSYELEDLLFVVGREMFNGRTYSIT